MTMFSLDHRPSVHVGASLDSLITKALESEATDLLPTIKSAVEAMLHPAPSPDTILGTSATTPSVGTSNTAEEASSSHTSSAVSLELPIHLLEFSSTLPATKKEPPSFTRGKPPKTRHLTAGDKKENGGKRIEPHTIKPISKEEKHKESKSKQAVEPLVSKLKASEKILAHSEPGSSSHKEDNEPNVSSVEVDDLENYRDTPTEAKDSFKKKSRQSQKEDNPTGKRLGSVVSRRQVRKRRFVLSSSEDEDEKEDEEKGPASSSESESHPPAELVEKKNRHRGTDKRRRRSSSGKGESASQDVIVTRSNRRVKPSIRYALSNQYQHEDKEEDEEVVNIEQEKVAVEVEERTSRESSAEREQSPNRKKLDQEEPVAKRLRRHK